jgi:pimeloyl-ACP methyl ester carboxylesterase
MSLGGLTALAYAGSHQASVKGLVLVDIGPAGGSGIGVERIRDFIAAPEEHATIDEFVEQAMTFNPLRNRERLRRSLLHNLRRTPEGTWTWKYDRRYRKPSPPDEAEIRVLEQRRELLWDAIANVDCPSLVVRGGLSDVFPAEYARETVDALKRGRLVTIDGAGHTVQGDQPHEFAAVLRKFLDSDVEGLDS